MIGLHLSAIEIVWIVASLVALYFTRKNYQESRADKEALQPLRNGRLVIANGSLRRDTVRMVKIAVMLLVGGAAAFVPGNPDSLVGYLFTGLLLMFPLLMAYDSAADNFDRRYLLKTHLKQHVPEEGYQQDDAQSGSH